MVNRLDLFLLNHTPSGAFDPFLDSAGRVVFTRWDHLQRDQQNNPDIYEESLKRKGCNEMNFTGRPMKGFVFISPEGTDMDEDLAYWIQLALDYNPLAKSSKKKSKK